MKRIIVGTGTFGQVARLYLEEFTPMKVDAFAVSRSSLEQVQDSDLDVLVIEDLITENPSNYEILVAIGYSKMNSIRESVYHQFDQAKFNFITFVHPSVKLWHNAKIGRNVFVFEDNTIQPFTKIGNNSIIWSGNHIGHHSEIGKNVFISSHVVISGDCQIGDNSFLGVNATIFDGVKIGPKCLIGGGSIVNRDLGAESVMVSQPSSKLQKKSSELDF
jgi:sugar O-acyltransferase (sialic acid O-acetyltransferase NeuD family)